MSDAEQPPAVRVLVVDDTADIRAVVRLVLEDGGRFVVVGEAVDGVEGVELARELQPDVVLLEVVRNANAPVICETSLDGVADDIAFLTAKL